MTSTRLLRRIAGLILCTICTLNFAIAAEPTAKRDAQSVMNELRMKRWTKDLSLTADQQKKFQALFDEEGKNISKITEDPNIDVNARRTKVNEIRETTYGKMKPLLTETQLPIFEKLTARSRPKKQQP